MSSNYLEFKFKIEPLQPASEILVAELGYLGFESFVEEEDGITAYIPAEEYED
ncbi:MAG: 50S ribosomal protein L11 methyltransferase, partial [Salegentibacter mishustinae]|nr:50S ribosomal protein L11 methyltransferase [Salegentibacter mishustinae]